MIEKDTINARLVEKILWQESFQKYPKQAITAKVNPVF
jgi:hypothetical protein|tara:strand:- start:1089 stop:1202 length:114 start_codon:yes stop_codon:yes gene_type:complete